MKLDDLRQLPKKELLQLAREHAIESARTMDKDALVQSLARRFSNLARRERRAAAKAGKLADTKVSDGSIGVTDRTRTVSKTPPAVGSVFLPLDGRPVDPVSARKKSPAANTALKAPAANAASKRPTRDELEPLNKQVLAQMAKASGINGWHGMRKSDLIAHLTGQHGTPVPAQGAARRLREEKKKTSARSKGRESASVSAAEAGKSEPTTFYIGDKGRIVTNLERRRKGPDRLALLVRDPFWLHVIWEVAYSTVERTAAALGPDWYTARPVLRLVRIGGEERGADGESVLREIPVHGGTNNWYVDIERAGLSLRADLGYLSARGKFYLIARSNVVRTPEQNQQSPIDQHWANVERDADRIFALSAGADSSESSPLRAFFEERLRRPMSVGTLTDYGTGAIGSNTRDDFHFQVDAELIVFGKTVADANVSINNEPVQTREDGSFTLRFALPEGRQVIPATSATRDGIEERTVVIMIERNTKTLEPMIHDGQEY